MTMYYSASRNAFFSSDITAVEDMPSDAVSLTDEEHAQVLAQQEAGYRIEADTSTGKPKAVAQSLNDCTRTTDAIDSEVVHIAGTETITGAKTFSSTISASVSGNAGTATKLKSARTIALSGDVTGSGSFDGSENLTITATVVDDSHNHVISNVDGLQTALDGKAALASPTFTGTPKAPTAAAGTNSTQVATTAFVTTAVANKTSVASATKATQDASGNVITSTYATKGEVTNAISSANSYTDTAVANLVDSAPETLNTIGEVATAIKEHQDVTDALNSAIGKKANDADVVKLTGNQTIAGTKTFSSTISGSISGNAATATKATQDGSGNVITSTYLTKADASSTYLGKTAKAASATVADSANAVAWGNVSGKPSSYTPSSHNQASSTINALTGYSKPSSTSALATSDTLNSALGKLEKALDGKLSASGTATKATADASGNTITSTYATKTELTNGLAGKSDSDHTHGAATSSAFGMVKVGSNITNSSGTISLTKDNVTTALGYVPSATDSTYSTFTGATSSTAGLSGLVPAPAKGKNTSFLRGDGTWVVPTDTKYTHPSYTAKSSGLYKVTVDATGHVSATTAVTKADITALGIPAQDTTYTLSSFGVNATATELNYCDGVTGNIQTQLNGKLSTSGTAAKATADANGKNIVSTYATKAEISSVVKVVSSSEGCRALSDGRIEQWGKALIASAGTEVVFPIAFPNAIESVVCTPIGSVVSFGVDIGEDNDAVTIKHNGNGGVEFFYRAIGS